MTRDDRWLYISNLIVQEVRRDVEDVLRSVEDTRARLERSKQLLQAYIAGSRDAAETEPQELNSSVRSTAP
jgi:hypothetical protein